MQVAFFGCVNAVQRRIPGAVRCTPPSWASEVRMSQLVARQSAPARVVRLAWARRLRRLTPLPWPSPRGLPERAPARFLSRTTRQWCAARWPFSTASRNSASVWARKRRQPVVHTWFMSQGSVTARAAHSAEDRRRHALFMAKPWNEPSRTGAGKSGARLRLDAALEAEDGGVNSAREQDSSIGEDAGYVCLGAVHMEEEVQDRVQVEVGREEQGEGETHGKEQGEEQRKNRRSINRSSWMTMNLGSRAQTRS